MKKISALSFFCVIAAYGFWTVNIRGENDAPYNVLFIAVDDLNDYVSLLENYPGVQTPNLDSFSEESVTFSRAYCAGPICCPSRTSVMTGLAPHVTGVYENDDHWVKSEPAVEATVMPEAFKSAGYTTLWAGKIFHDLSAPSKDRLVAMWDEMGTNVPGALWDGSTNLVPYGPSTEDGFGVLEPDSVFADVTNVELAKEWLSQDYDQPFFMAFGVIRPHRPWTAPQRFFDMYPLEALGLPPGYLENDLEDLPTGAHEIIGARGVNMTRLRENGRWKATLQAYLASVSFADETIGNLLKALSESRYAENTVIILWGDHGYHMGEKEHMGKWTLWEQATRNLLMVKVPGMDHEGAVCNQVVSLLDIYPTLVELCDLKEVNQELSGNSLMELLHAPEAKRDEPVLTSYPYLNHGLRDNQYRFIKYADGTEELYDHREDNYEWVNLARDPRYEGVLKRMRTFLPVENAEPVGPVPELKVWQEERRKKREDAKTFGTVTN